MADAMEFERSCAECGDPFTARRADKRFCSTACKSKNNRGQDPVTVRATAAVRAFERLVEIADDEVLMAFADRVARTVTAKRESRS